MFIQPNPKQSPLTFLTPSNPHPKKISIFFPLTIPATGKSTIFTHLANHLKQYYLQIVSSDEIRSEEMEKVLGKVENGKDKEKGQGQGQGEGQEEVGEKKRREAYLKTKEIADREFYARVQKILKEIEIVEGDEYKGYGIFLDKNYSKLTLDNAILQIKKIATKFQNSQIQLIGILPKTNSTLTLPNNNSYPFSLSYLCCCLKRLLSRSSHPTLFGPKSHLIKTCLFWAKNLQSFPVPPQNLHKVIRVCFTRQQEIPEKIGKYVEKMLMEGEVGKYGEEMDVGELVEELGKWEMEEVEIGGIEAEVREEFGKLFWKF